MSTCPTYTQTQLEQLKKRTVYEHPIQNMTKKQRYAYIQKHGVRYLPPQHTHIDRSTSKIFIGGVEQCNAKV